MDTLRRDCSDRLLIFGTGQLEAVLTEYPITTTNIALTSRWANDLPTRTRKRNYPSPAAGSPVARSLGGLIHELGSAA